MMYKELYLNGVSIKVNWSENKGSKTEFDFTIVDVNDQEIHIPVGFDELDKLVTFILELHMDTE